jgi:hypothetical protein
MTHFGRRKRGGRRALARPVACVQPDWSSRYLVIRNVNLKKNFSITRTFSDMPVSNLAFLHPRNKIFREVSKDPRKLGPVLWLDSLVVLLPFRITISPLNCQL